MRAEIIKEIESAILKHKDNPAVQMPATALLPLLKANLNSTDPLLSKEEEELLLDTRMAAKNAEASNEGM